MSADHTDPTVEKINSLWHQSRIVEAVPVPQSFPQPHNNSWLAWALALAQHDPKLVGTAMRSALKGLPEDDNHMIYLSRGSASDKVRQAMLDGVANQAPVQLQVNSVSTKDSRVGEFIHQAFADCLQQVFPYGYGLAATLWITGPGHTYNVHCDLGDHVLLQLAGRKRIRFWKPKPGFDQVELLQLDFRSHPELFFGELCDMELSSGQAVFFSKGVMHEISIPEGDSSVTVTIAADHLWPLKNVVIDLNATEANPKAYSLPEHYDHWDKFRAILFNPHRHHQPEHLEHGLIPDRLQQAFLQVIEASSDDYQNRLSGALQNWWQNLARTRKFSPTGSLPEAPANREELLKKWEDERLAQNLAI